MESQVKKSRFSRTTSASMGAPWPKCGYLLRLNQGRNSPWDLYELDYWAPF